MTGSNIWILNLSFSSFK